MDWKKIGRAVCGMFAAALLCIAAAGVSAEPVYAADMALYTESLNAGQAGVNIMGTEQQPVQKSGNYVTAIRASLSGQPEGMSGTLSYQVNLSGTGWLAWQENMAENGSTDTDMPLEAVRMTFTGQLAENYDIYYSVFQNGAWTTPVKNGETAGTEDRDSAWTVCGSQ